MTASERDYLYGWLAAHPQAWHGWPTYRALDGRDILERVRRLQRHGCPFRGRGVVEEVDDLVYALRKDRAARYAGRVFNAL